MLSNYSIGLAACQAPKYSISMNRIGEKLYTLRQHRGLTSRALGKLLGVSNAYIIQIENGQRRPSIDVVAEISRYFQVPAD